MHSKKPHLFFPLIDNGMGLARADWSLAMCALCLSKWFRDYQVTMQCCSYPYPDGAMNLVTHDFLLSKCDEMVVIDEDIFFKPEDVQMLLEHDLPLVFGLYPKKEPGLVWPVVPLHGNPKPFEGEQALCEVACAARGFMRVKREVFDKLAPTTEVVQDTRMANPNVRRFWLSMGSGHSEDFYFCNSYRAIGGKVFIDKRITTQHIGTVKFPIKGTY